MRFALLYGRFRLFIQKFQNLTNLTRHATGTMRTSSVKRQISNVERQNGPGCSPRNRNDTVHTILTEFLIVRLARSPVFSHLSASLTGISTIRSRGLQTRLAREFDELQDVHSGIWQLTMSANTALGLWLDCVSTAFVACVTFSFIAMFDSKLYKLTLEK